MSVPAQVRIRSRVSKAQERISLISFVFLGKRLPHYGPSSLRLAARHSGLPISLIGSRSLSSQVPRGTCDFVAIEDFYNSEEFQEVQHLLRAPKSFRQGLWHKSLERFFVLNQYLSISRERSVLHAELDQLLFRTDILLSGMETSTQSGLFFPLHDNTTGIASIFYCNDKKALQSFVDFVDTSTVKDLQNEMRLLGAWTSADSNRFVELPTLNRLLYAPSPSERNRRVAFDSRVGLVDAAQLGQWCGGIDPRNVPRHEIPSTGYAEEAAAPPLLTPSDLSKTSFQLDRESGELWVDNPGTEESRLFNLHMHSKIHPWLEESDSNMHLLMSAATNGRPLVVPGTTRMQNSEIARQTLKRAERRISKKFTRLLRRINRILSGLLSLFSVSASSYPFLSGDTFKEMGYVWKIGRKDQTLRRTKAARRVVFCVSEDLEECVEGVRALNAPTTIVAGNSDRLIAGPILDTIPKDGSVMVFAQNLNEPHQFADVLPIGLENRSLIGNGQIRHFKKPGSKSHSRVHLVFWTFDVATNPVVRGAAKQVLRELPIAYEAGKLTPRSHRDHLRKFAFVAAPPGNGLDTHRVWEAMYLGCVPVVYRSFLTSRLFEMGFPVFLVDSFEDLRAMNTRTLRSNYLNLLPRFSSPLLHARFWEMRFALPTFPAISVSHNQHAKQSWK